MSQYFRKLLMGLLLLSPLLTADLSPPSAPPLTSMIELRDTPIARWWFPWYLRLEKQFPQLEFIPPQSLHITVLSFGMWKTEDHDFLANLAFVVPKETMESYLHFAWLKGTSQLWLALGLNTPPPSWVQSVINAKGDLVEQGLAKASPYDHSYFPHISLAATRHTPPTADELSALFQVQSALQYSLKSFLFVLTPEDVKRAYHFWGGQPEQKALPAKAA